MDHSIRFKLPAPSQIALVVNDCNKTKGFYSACFGIGPWWLVEQDYPEIIVRGRKSAYKIRIAVADLGSIDLKLIQLISGRSLYSEYLQEGREGFHHLTFDLNKEVQNQFINNLEQAGNEVIEHGISVLGTGAKCGLLNTDRIGGSIFKLRYRPTKNRPPAFELETNDLNRREFKLPDPSQIGSVVKDLEKTMEFYSMAFGIGPWQIAELDYPQIMLHGLKSAYKIKIARADLGGKELELIQPISGRSLYSEFLGEGKEGLHHLTFDISREDMEKARIHFKKNGIEVVQGAMDMFCDDDINFAYINTDKIGGALFKLRC